MSKQPILLLQLQVIAISFYRFQEPRLAKEQGFDIHELVLFLDELEWY